jgi:hypothetical protein
METVLVTGISIADSGGESRTNEKELGIDP